MNDLSVHDCYLPKRILSLELTYSRRTFSHTCMKIFLLRTKLQRKEWNVSDSALILPISQAKLTNWHDHQYGWDTKSQWIAVLVSKAMNIASQDWRKCSWKDRSKINGEVEQRKERSKLCGLQRKLELVTAKSRNARLYTTTTHGNKHQSNEQSNFWWNILYRNST